MSTNPNIRCEICGEEATSFGGDFALCITHSREKDQMLEARATYKRLSPQFIELYKKNNARR